MPRCAGYGVITVPTGRKPSPGTLELAAVSLSL
jgi:hypothetical protein